MAAAPVGIAPQWTVSTGQWIMTPSSPRRSRCRCLGRPGKRGYCAPLSQPPSKQRSEASGVNTLQLGRRLRGYRDATNQADLQKSSEEDVANNSQKGCSLNAEILFFSHDSTKEFRQYRASSLSSQPNHHRPHPFESSTFIPRTSSRPTPGVRIIRLLSWGNVCETRRTSTLRIQALHRCRGWGCDMEHLIRGEVYDDARTAASNLLLAGVRDARLTSMFKLGETAQGT